MFVLFFLKKYVLCEILRFKVFGLVTSFQTKEEEGLLIHLRQTTSACYRLGYCDVLVIRVLSPNVKNRH